MPIEKSFHYCVFLSCLIYQYIRENRRMCVINFASSKIDISYFKSPYRYKHS